MQYYYLNEYNPNTKYLEQASAILNEGGLICYPSETSYGIACLLSNSVGVKKLNLLSEKHKRGKNQTLICKDFNQISTYAYLPNHVFKIMKKALPGPYTFILQATSLVPKVFQTKRETVGFRISDYIILENLLTILNAPLVSFSAISSASNIEYVSIGELEDIYKNDIDLILDVGEIYITKTTVVDFSSGEPLIIRKGAGEVFF